ncbi:MAG: hypothetical protein MRK01_10380 [Candidatus Scalindua sp.]|nr:hypothetical protein [Candidatus Scalindua sp.]
MVTISGVDIGLVSTLLGRDAENKIGDAAKETVKKATDTFRRYCPLENEALSPPLSGLVLYSSHTGFRIKFEIKLSE